jgi:hypothetical protein
VNEKSRINLWGIRVALFQECPGRHLKIARILIRRLPRRTSLENILWNE